MQRNKHARVVVTSILVKLQVKIATTQCFGDCHNRRFADKSCCLELLAQDSRVVLAATLLCCFAAL